MKLGVFCPLASPVADAAFVRDLRRDGGAARLRFALGRGARRAVRRVRLEVPVLGRRAHPGPADERRARAAHEPRLPRGGDEPDPAGHGDPAGPATQSGVHGEGGRERRLALGRTARPGRRRGLAGRGVPRRRRALGAARRAHALLHRGDAAALVRRAVGVQGRVLRAARVPAVPEARAEGGACRSTSAARATRRCSAPRTSGRAGTASTSSRTASRNDSRVSTACSRANGRKRSDLVDLRLAVPARDDAREARGVPARRRRPGDPDRDGARPRGDRRRRSRSSPSSTCRRRGGSRDSTPRARSRCSARWSAAGRWARSPAGDSRARS